jgi:hypothetical protein
MSGRPFVRFFAFGGLASALLLGVGGCANVARNTAELELELTVTQAGHPAPLKRFIIWVDEQHAEELTDQQGHISYRTDYPWDAQVLDVPGVGPLRHSPAPAVELRLYGDEDHPIEGKRTLEKLPHNAWKLSIAVDLPAA